MYRCISDLQKKNLFQLIKHDHGWGNKYRVKRLKKIFELFDDSITYQEKNGYPVWRNYDKDAIVKDIENKNQYKVVVDSKTTIVFSVRYTDKVIWRDLDKGDSIYLHRIVVNPKFKGQQPDNY